MNKYRFRCTITVDMFVDAENETDAYNKVEDDVDTDKYIAEHGGNEYEYDLLGIVGEDGKVYSHRKSTPEGARDCGFDRSWNGS